MKLGNKNTSDFFIVDIEYDLGNMGIGKKAKFDMIAIEKIGDEYQLVLVENKVGRGSLNGKGDGSDSGVGDHIKHMYDIASHKETLDKFKKNIKLIANQLIELDIIECQKEKIDSIIETSKVKVLFPVSYYWSYPVKNKSNIHSQLTKFIKHIKDDKNKDIDFSRDDFPLDIKFLFLGDFEDKKTDNDFIYNQKDTKHLLNINKVIEKKY